MNPALILLLDNYDSFVHNLARYFARLGQQTLVVRNDAIDAAGARRLAPGAIVLSPGPCTPSEAGSSLEIVRELHGEIPMLGICLGHQAFAAALGGRVVRSPEPVHGRTSEIFHRGTGVFRDLPNPLTACRYHSLCVEEVTLPKDLEVTAKTADGVVMGLAHRRLPVVGLQFHPEAILTDCGYRLLASFLTLAGLDVPADVPSRATELEEPPSPGDVLPTRPVTF